MLRERARRLARGEQMKAVWLDQPTCHHENDTCYCVGKALQKERARILEELAFRVNPTTGDLITIVLNDHRGN